MEVLSTSIDVGLDYCEHFGLNRLPFNDSVNPEFFYRTETHESAFVRMMVCAKQHKALGLVWGRSGTGKTLVAQMLLTGLSETEVVPVVVCAHPGMSRMALLGCILDELDITRPGGRENAQKYLDALHAYLMQAYAMGQRVVIVIDEAHFLPSDQLHMVRTLTNLETPQEKLCTIIMLAEETFPQRLRHKKYSSLRSRIALGAYLMPLSRQETEQYVKFRLMVAGAVEEILDPECYELIFSRSNGICREVSKLADGMLLEAFLRGENRVTEPIARQCIQNSV